MNAASIFLWVMVLGVAVGLGTLILRRKSPEWGFKELVKNPRYWKELFRTQDEADAAAQAAHAWSDEKVLAATKHFLFEIKSSRDAWAEGRALKTLGERTQRIVIELLRETSRYGFLVKPTGVDTLPEAPFNRACDLLGDSPPQEAVEVLAPFLSDASDEIRKDAALVIGKTGAETIAPLVKKAFADEDEYVRSYALTGLEFALDRNGLSDQVRRELFPEVLELLRAGKNSDSAAKILYGLDKERATGFFLSEEILSADSPSLHQILRVLADMKQQVSRERIQSLIAALERKEMKYPQTYALGEALRLLGQHRMQEDRDFLRARMNRADDRVNWGASTGLLCSYGLEGSEVRIWEIEKNRGYESLSREQKLYRAVMRCDGEINNGGLAQYFVNSSGDDWRDAVSGFKEMGFEERRKILDEAIAMFGEAGPSTDRTARQKQLKKIYQRNDAAFEELDDRYYKSSEAVKVLMTRFVLAHAEVFD
jgi:HEAT repeat protein